MAEIIKGADVACSIKKELSALISDNRLSPCLLLVSVGDDDSNTAYIRGIRKTCSELGIELKETVFPMDIDQKDFDSEFTALNRDDSVDGILLLRPLPSHLEERHAADIIDPAKDIDCMSPYNWAMLAMGDPDGFYPCTAEAVIKICDHAGIDINGKKAVIIGRSKVIGRPAGLLFLSRNATVTWCHTRTKDIAQMCRGAEILVSACGQAELIGESIAKGIDPSCIAIDVGVNFKDGKMKGDFVFDEVARYASMITPVPGGVGAVTNTILAAHTVSAALKKNSGMNK